MKRASRLSAALLAAACLVAAPAGAQKARSGDDMEARYKKKLEKEFISRADWKMTLAEAMATAKAKDTLILGYFTRSYAQ